jgi:hypothetical protein
LPLQGAEVAVKVLVCYEAAFVTFQLLCHLADAKLPLSRAARIEARHMIGAATMVFVILVRQAALAPSVALYGFNRVVWLTSIAPVMLLLGDRKRMPAHP